MASSRVTKGKKGSKTKHESDIDLFDGKNGNLDYKEAHEALKKAFDDLKTKYFQTTKENTRLKKRLSKRSLPSQSVQKQYSHASNTFNDVHSMQDLDNIQRQEEEIDLYKQEVEDLQQDIKELKDKLSKSFSAYNEKYQECVKLKSTCERYEERLKESGTFAKDQEPFEEQKDEPSSEEAAPRKAYVLHKPPCTQTPAEEDTNNLNASVLNSFLHKYGLEAVTEGGQSFLMITERDIFNNWVVKFTGCLQGGGNTTSSQVLQDIETQTHSLGSFYKVSDSIEELKQRCSHYEYKETLLKQKITDQASELKRLYEMLDGLYKKTRSNEEKHPQVSDHSTTSDGETNLNDAKKARLKGLITNITRIISDSSSLQDQLIEQKNHVRYLVESINRTKEAHRVLVSRLAAHKGRGHAGGLRLGEEGAETSERDREYRTFHPNVRIEASERTRQYWTVNPNVHGTASAVTTPMVNPRDFGQPVQESDLKSLPSRKRDSYKSICYEREDLALKQKDEMPPLRHFDVPPPPRSIIDSITGTRNLDQQAPAGLTGYESGMTTLPSPPLSVLDYPPPPVVVFKDDDDVIVIEDDEESALGATSGDRERMICPMCREVFAPGTSQDHFERHVNEHFNDH